MKKLSVFFCLLLALTLQTHQSAQAYPLDKGEQLMFGAASVATIGVICPACLAVAYGAAGVSYLALNATERNDKSKEEVSKLRRLREDLDYTLNKGTFALNSPNRKELQAIFADTNCNIKNTAKIFAAQHSGEYEGYRGTSEENLSHVIMSLRYITHDISCVEIDSDGQVLAAPPGRCGSNELGKHINFRSKLVTPTLAEGDLTGVYASVSDIFNQDANSLCAYAKAAPQIREAISQEINAIDDTINKLTEKSK